jgi:ArsR family transcriptional regulator
MTAPSHELQTLKAELFRAIAHPLRIRIVELLAQHERRTVQQLQNALEIGQPIVSQHLARLRRGGIVAARKEGTTVVYTLADARLAELLSVAKAILNRRLTGTQALLRELRADRLS